MMCHRLRNLDFVFIYNPLIYLSHVESVKIRKKKKNHILLSCFVDYLRRIAFTNEGNNLLLSKKYSKVHDNIIFGIRLNGVLGFSLNSVFAL